MLERDAEELSTTPDTTQQLPQVPSGKSLPPPHFCSKKRGERKSHYHTRLLSQCLPQSRGDDVIGNHPIKADGAFDTRHKCGTELGQEESHCSSTCCLVSRTHNKWLVGSKGGKKRWVFAASLEKNYHLLLL